ncbi:MAG: ABC transporter permease subunit [Gammaproteobacteria bacterium]|nr:ABC transporter permease subunit [Gammaproteobacteria bacterium]
MRVRKWLRPLSLLILIIVWHVSASLVDSEVFPTPYSVFLSLQDHILTGDLFYHLGITLKRVFLAFIIAMLVGTFIGYMMGRNEWINESLDSLLLLSLNIPALVTIILCYLWIGLTDLAAITAVAINKIPTVAVMLREGARALDKQLLQVAEVYRVGRLKTFRHVVLPQLYPYLFASARSGLALIWKIVLVVELLGRSNGVGFQLGVFFNFFDITSILAYTVAFALVIFLVEVLFMRPIERISGKWRA